MSNEQKGERWWIREYNRQACRNFKPTKNKFISRINLGKTKDGVF